MMLCTLARSPASWEARLPQKFSADTTVSLAEPEPATRAGGLERLQPATSAAAASSVRTRRALRRDMAAWEPSKQNKIVSYKRPGLLLLRLCSRRMSAKGVGLDLGEPDGSRDSTRPA